MTVLVGVTVALVIGFPYTVLFEPISAGTVKVSLLPFASVAIPSNVVVIEPSLETVRAALLLLAVRTFEVEEAGASA